MQKLFTKKLTPVDEQSSYKVKNDENKQKKAYEQAILLKKAIQKIGHNFKSKNASAVRTKACKGNVNAGSVTTTFEITISNVCLKTK